MVERSNSNPDIPGLDLRGSGAKRSQKMHKKVDHKAYSGLWKEEPNL